MAADRHHLVRMLASGDLADYVGAGVFADHAAIEIELQRHRLAVGQHAIELVGVGIGQRGGGNRLGRIAEAGDAGMRGTLLRVGAGRAQQVAGGALGLGDHRAHRAHGRAHAVAVAVLRALHAVADVDDLALDAGRVGRLQRIQRIEFHHLGGQPAFRRVGRIAQRGQHQRLRERCHDRGVFAAAHPQRVRHRFGVDLVVAELLELRHGPVAGALVGVAAGHARADLGGQRCGDLVRGVVVQRLVAQLFGRLYRRGGNRGVGGAGDAAGQQAGGEQGEGKTAHRGTPLGKPRLWRCCRLPLRPEVMGGRGPL